MPRRNPGQATTGAQRAKANGHARQFRRTTRALRSLSKTGVQAIDLAALERIAREDAQRRTEGA